MGLSQRHWLSTNPSRTGIQAAIRGRLRAERPATTSELIASFEPVAIPPLPSSTVSGPTDERAIDIFGEILLGRNAEAEGNNVLRRWGVGPDVMVGLCVERSLEI